MQCTWCFGIHLLFLVAGVLYMCEAARSTAPSMQSSGLYKACSDVQSALGNASLPEELARICDGLRINDKVCQCFSYNSSAQRAYFKGQPPSTLFDMQKACNYPDFSLWVLKSGEFCNLSRHAEVFVAFTSGIWPFMLTMLTNRHNQRPHFREGNTAFCRRRYVLTLLASRILMVMT